MLACDDQYNYMSIQRQIDQELPVVLHDISFNFSQSSLPSFQALSHTNPDLSHQESHDSLLFAPKLAVASQLCIVFKHTSLFDMRPINGSQSRGCCCFLHRQMERVFPESLHEIFPLLPQSTLLSSQASSHVRPDLSHQESQDSLSFADRFAVASQMSTLLRQTSLPHMRSNMVSQRRGALFDGGSIGDDVGGLVGCLVGILVGCFVGYLEGRFV